jgi:hypothetical protein
MLIDRNVVQAALEALEMRCGTHAEERQPGGSIDVLRAALAAEQPEPVALVIPSGVRRLDHFDDLPLGTPLYASPPAQPEPQPEPPKVGSNDGLGPF